MKSYDFIKMYKKNNGLPSDYAAAKKLEISRAAISNYKNGRPLDEDLALRIAQNLGISPSKILYVIAEERSKNPKIKKIWKELQKQLHNGIAASFTLLISLTIFAGNTAEYILC